MQLKQKHKTIKNIKHYEKDRSVFLAQLVGNAIITLSTFAVAMLVMFIVNKLPYPFKLRVEPKGETAFGGLDVFEHGAEAYNN